MRTRTRRQALRLFGGTAVLMGLPGLTFAKAPPAPRANDRRLVFMFLRGGMDGLSAVPPYGDPQYAPQRGPLAVPAAGTPGGALNLDGHFGLSPHLAEMHKLFAAQELAVLHAAASPYRERSHFDAQNLIENGTVRPFGREAGWLNIALGVAGRAGTVPSGTAGFALGPNVPLVLRGPAQIGSWSPSRLPQPDADLLDRLATLYQGDALLGRSFAVAREAQAMMQGQHGDGMGGRTQPVAELARAAGEVLGRPHGPRVATIDFGGWDTHISQQGEYSQLTRNLRLLDRSVAALRMALGPVWQHTAVLIVTEFGRAVAPNGSGGTDHGTAGVAFVAGGAVRGGRVISDWPGLGQRALHEGRDLRPTLDLRALFKAALASQLGLDEAALETEVFPDSRAVRPLEGIFL
jgi:uncharacterized protein (DUF1501 family)